VTPSLQQAAGAASSRHWSMVPSCSASSLWCRASRMRRAATRGGTRMSCAARCVSNSSCCWPAPCSETGSATGASAPWCSCRLALVRRQSALLGPT
jgi:hypothetical protein